MAGKKGGENTKKAAGNARKAEAAAQKEAAANARKAEEEAREWSKGAKSSAKKEQAETKKAEAARKKAEREAQLAAEEASLPSKPKGAGAKSASKKNLPRAGTLDLSQLDADEKPTGHKKATPALNATGIDNALDALSLTTSSETTKIDRHPERRFKAAYAAFERRRLPEIEQEQPGLRRQQRIEVVRKEFEKSEENPFNQATVAFDATREEVMAVKEAERRKIEGRLVGKRDL
ncbi:uncharacterized protein BDCG_04841 [Blastomyces dermatitidis ER-3]|uniref:DUF1014 domain-containing protein n=2 Tax=Ajellomyces dermatitidis TaxID=5039 RepID=F2TUD6_AJEDA|nr:uncharacterized protein BDCG_04841 [Blastomyces dermatitidis ER-3]EEQ89721.2 hypothetical protein BDCG_04841 [Blastomyces dermatitidis ER-3]EGE86849.2 DUF1014 domain-containing protein [Blastomyces dermatitidis ATCC 18188]